MGNFIGEAVIPYDRVAPDDLFALAPFPDDFWLVPDASTPTGHRVDLSVPSRDIDVVLFFFALMAETRTLDGFSPVGGIVIALFLRSLSPSCLHSRPRPSLDPSATVQLIDVTAGSEELGRMSAIQLSPVSRQLAGQ